MEYLVTLTININADTPLDAAVQTQSWLRDTESNWVFQVMDEDENVVSVDLNEDSAEVVVPMDKPKVIIEVVGGVAYVQSCPQGVEVEIVDWDNIKNG